jgi:hypothetical protein
MSATITRLLTLNTLECASCGICFAIPGSFERQRRDDGETFYCPSGHKNVYRKTEAQRLMEQLKAKERELRAVKCDILREQKLRTDERIAREKVERKLKRVHRGVCPCCKRTFQNIQRHMETKHPETLKQ